MKFTSLFRQSEANIARISRPIADRRLLVVVCNITICVRYYRYINDAILCPSSPRSLAGENDGFCILFTCNEHSTCNIPLLFTYLQNSYLKTYTTVVSGTSLN